MMKAAVVTGFKQPLEIKQVEIPKPGPTDVLIKNIACGVCHTDLHSANGGEEQEDILCQFIILSSVHRLGCETSITTYSRS